MDVELNFFSPFSQIYISYSRTHVNFTSAPRFGVGFHCSVGAFAKQSASATADGCDSSHSSILSSGPWSRTRPSMSCRERGVVFSYLLERAFFIILKYWLYTRKSGFENTSLSVCHRNVVICLSELTPSSFLALFRLPKHSQKNEKAKDGQATAQQL